MGYRTLAYQGSRASTQQVFYINLGWALKSKYVSTGLFFFFFGT